jgi:cell division protein FtsQ
MLVLVAEVIWLGASSPLLVVRNVTVTGATVRPPDEIKKIARLTKPVNLFRAPTRKAVSLLKALPEVATARVERHLPNSLAIVVTERTPLASVLTPQGCWVMDGSGIVFRSIAAPLDTVPVFAMTPSAPIVVGKPLPTTALKAALTTLTGVDKLPLAPNVRVHLEANGDVWLQNTNGLKIRLGQLDDAPDRLPLTERMLTGPNGPDLISKLLVLDMTSPGNEYTKRRPEYKDFRFAGGQNQ